MAENDKFADEKLTDDELDRVAGGDCSETANDSRFLNSLNGSTDRYGATRLLFTGGDSDDKICAEIEAGWAKVGIKATINTSAASRNLYSLNGTYISQEEARQHAMNVTGHHMTEKDWNW